MNDFNEKTIMITGSSGLIGSNLVKSLLMVIWDTMVY